MWYEILPSAAIVFAALYAPHLINFGLNKIFRHGKVQSVLGFLYSTV